MGGRVVGGPSRRGFLKGLGAAAVAAGGVRCSPRAAVRARAAATTGARASCPARSPCGAGRTRRRSSRP
ncbi:twin-arginine translocation signal domain-containing protein [Kitasatospora aburaviensis]